MPLSELLTPVPLPAWEPVPGGGSRMIEAPGWSFDRRLELRRRQQDLVNRVALALGMAAAKRVALRLAATQMRGYPQYDKAFDPDQWSVAVANAVRTKMGDATMDGDVVLLSVAERDWRDGRAIWSMRNAVRTSVCHHDVVEFGGPQSRRPR